MPKGTIDFLVIGAQKAATTSLHQYLSEHPAIYVPPEKEVMFFSSRERYARGMQWYVREHFSAARDNQAWGEVSPHYMCYPETPQRIAALAPTVKLIALLRNPIDRAYSHYRMSVRRGLENRAFEEAVRDSVYRECRSDADVQENFDYVQFSRYGTILSRYLKHFAGQQIRVYFTENLSARPREVLADVFRFLGVDNSFVPGNLRVRYHVGGERRFAWLGFLVPSGLVQRIALSVLPRSVGRYLNFWLEQWSVLPVTDEGPPERVRAELREHLRSEVALLRELFACDPPWEEFGE